MRNVKTVSTALLGMALAIMLTTASCDAKSHSGKKGKSEKGQAGKKTPGRKAGRQARHPARPLPSQVKLSLHEVESLLKKATPPKGGQVLALVYAGGIKGEIEPCG